MVLQQCCADIDGVPVSYDLRVQCGSRTAEVIEARMPLMVTLTEPAEWLTVCPNGKEAKRHLRVWREGYRRAWGHRWYGVIKEEFMHEFRAPLSAVAARLEDPPDDLTWADVIERATGHPEFLAGLPLGRPHFHMHTNLPVRTDRSAGERSFLADLTWDQLLDLADTDPEAIRRCKGKLGGMRFREWLSVSWALTVNHPDSVEFGKNVRAGTSVDTVEPLRASDPKRMALYFLKKHTDAAEGSGKEYQNVPPDAWQQPGQGPGRFWLTPGMDRARVAVEITDEDRVRVGRIMRRWGRTQDAVKWTWGSTDDHPDTTQPYPNLVTLNSDRHTVVKALTQRRTVRRTRGGEAVSKYPEVIGLAGAMILESRRPHYRHSQVRVKRTPNNRGWVACNDGPAFAIQIAHWLALANQ
jgi:hypothetical protein